MAQISTKSRHQIVADLMTSNLEIGEQIRFRVTSNSMKPLMCVNDIVLADVIAGEKIRCGDIIIIKRPDDFLTHRAITPTPDGWLTKGDNNVQLDPPARSNDLIGRVHTVQQPGQTIDLRARKWLYIGPLLAKLGQLQSAAYSYHRFLQLPFRIMIKGVQKIAL